MEQLDFEFFDFDRNPGLREAEWFALIIQLAVEQSGLASGLDPDCIEED